MLIVLPERSSGGLRRTATGCLLLLALPVLLRAQPAEGLSARRVDELGRLVREQIERSAADVDDADVVTAVLGRFARLDSCPVSPTEPPVSDTDALIAASDTVARLTQERFPVFDEDGVEAEAAAKYPIYKLGDHVVVRYKPNPVRFYEVSGAYRGRLEDSVVVGSNTIPLQFIAILPQNAGEALKFDAPRSLQLREKHIVDRRTAYERERAAYVEQATAAAVKAERELATQANEANGYIWAGAAWRTLPEAVRHLLGIERERLALERAAELARQAAAMAAVRPVRPAVAPPAAGGGDDPAAPPFTAPDPATAVETVPPTTVPEPVPTTAGMGTEPAPQPARSTTDPLPPAEGIPGVIYAVLIGVILFIVALIILLAMSRRSPSGANLEAERFFQGRGKLQKNFWQMAEDDPETFKYVAFRYPSAQIARQAILDLSYVHEGTAGSLSVDRPILFGSYQHRDGFVAFVGGKELGYAMWREASALFPEQPGAEYFRVSTAPEVALEIPDVQQFAEDENLDIHYVEQRDGEDFSQYRFYRAADKTAAVAFLRRVAVKSTDVTVVVETPEGTVGKDINGIFED